MKLRTIGIVKQTARPKGTGILVAARLFLVAPAAFSQLPSYTGAGRNAALAVDARYRRAVGVQNVHVVRSAPDNPGATDGQPSIYRHHQFVTHRGGRVWVMPDGDTAARLGRYTNGLDRSSADSSPSSRRRRSPRVTDSPALCWNAPFSCTDSDTPPSFLSSEVAGMTKLSCSK